MKKLTVIYALVLLVFGFGATGSFLSAAWGTTYYVDSVNGLDGNSGQSEGAAWQTIDKVNGINFSPGDFILFKRGCVWREQLVIPSSGSDGNPITYGAYGTGDLPLILGSTQMTSWSDLSGNIWVTTCSVSDTEMVYVNGVRGQLKTSKIDLEEENDFYWCAPDSLFLYRACDPDTAVVEVPSRLYGVHGNNKDYIAMNSLEVKYPARKFFFLNEYCNYWTVSYCKGSRNGRTYLGEGSVADRLGFDIQGTHHTVSHCWSEEAGGNGIDCKGDNCIVEYCTVVDAHHNYFDMKGNHRDNIIQYCTAYSTSSFKWTSGETCNGIYIGNYDNQGPHNIRICGNVIYNIPYHNYSGGTGISLGGDSTAAADSVYIYNNTVADCSGSAYYILNDEGHAFLNNNIAYQSTNGMAIRLMNSANKVIDNNTWYCSSQPWAKYGTDNYPTFEDWQLPPYSFDIQSNNTDPKFVDAENHDYRIKRISPAVDGGVSISGYTQDRDGTAVPYPNPLTDPDVPDMGAYEYPRLVVSFTSPTSETSWEKSTEHSITWTCTGMAENVNLKYSTNNGSTWNEIGSSVAVSAGVYSWTLPNISSSEYLVRACTSDSSSYFGSSDAFNVTSGSLLFNGGFESYTESTPDNFSNWTGYQSGSSTVNEDTSEKYSGSLSLRLATDDSSSSVYVYQDVTLEANTSYELTYYDKQSGTADQFCRISYYSGGSTYYLQDDGSWLAETWAAREYSHASDWTLRTIDFTTQNFAGSYRFLLSRGGGSSSSYWFDEVMLTKQMILNAGFESFSEASPNDNFDNWTEYREGSCTINADTAVSHSGSVSLRLDTDGVPSICYVSQYVTLEANASYELTYYDKQSGAGGHQTRISFFSDSTYYLMDNGTWTTTWDSRTFSYVSDWTERTITFTTPDYSGSYMIMLTRTNGASSSFWFDEVALYKTITVGKPVAEFGESEQLESQKPIPFALKGNYPNPFNPSTTVEYSIDTRTQVELAIYNIAGQKVAVLENRVMDAGRYRTIWSSDNLASGVYFARLTTKKGILTCKMLFLK